MGIKIVTLNVNKINKNEVENYLRDNINILSRATFRYALEKMPKDLRRIWYMNQTLINEWSYDVLAFQIKSELYERQVLGDKPNNFNDSLPIFH